MTKPNAVEEMIARHVAAATLPDWTTLPPAITEDVEVARTIIASQNAAGLAVVPHDWNHREEDWSLESVAKWLTAALEESKKG